MELFQPQLELIEEPDRDFTLRASTMTPDGYYVAGRAEATTPPNVLVLPEVKPVLLHIQKRNKLCTDALEPLHHQIHDLELSQGQDKVAAFAMLDGHLVGSAIVSVDESRDCEHPGTLTDTLDWNTWFSLASPGLPRLHVQGNVILSNPAYVAELVRHWPDEHSCENHVALVPPVGYRRWQHPAPTSGLIHEVLELDLLVHRREGVFPRVIAADVVRFSTEHVDHVERVRIYLPHGDIIGLTVPRTH